MKRPQQVPNIHKKPKRNLAPYWTHTQMCSKTAHLDSISSISFYLRFCWCIFSLQLKIPHNSPVFHFLERFPSHLFQPNKPTAHCSFTYHRYDQLNCKEWEKNITRRQSHGVLPSEFYVVDKAGRFTEWDLSSSVATFLLDIKTDTKWETPSWWNAAEKPCLTNFFSPSKKPWTPLRQIWHREN